MSRGNQRKSLTQRRRARRVKANQKYPASVSLRNRGQALIGDVALAGPFFPPFLSLFELKSETGEDRFYACLLFL